MKVVGYHIDRTGIYTSEGERFTGDYLANLLTEKPDTIRVFSNLDACVANLSALIHLTPKEVKYMFENRSKMARLFGANLTIQYYPDKHFLVGKGWVNKWEAYSQFSDASQYCQELKQFGNGVGGFGKAKLAQKVGREVYDIYVELDFEPKSLTSPVSVFRKHTFEKLDLPDIADVPMEAAMLAQDCCKGGWFEAFKLGHFDHIYDYDLNASYPSEAAELLDLRYGKWLHTPEYQKDADYGYCNCDVVIDADFSPVTWQAEEGYHDRNYTLKGSFPAFLTKGMVDFIRNRSLGTVEIKDAWWWTGYSKTKPLEHLVNHYYNLRQSSTGLKKQIIKTILVGGFYGLFLQTYGDTPAKHFLPCYAAEILTNIKLRVASTCLDNNVKPLAITADGFVSETPIELTDPNELGEWRLANEGKALIVSSGVVAIEGKVGGGEFALDYNWIMEQIKQHPEASSYPMSKQASLSLPLAYQRDKLADAGKIELETMNINIMEGKRMYADKPSTGSELLAKTYDSQPYDAELLMSLKRLRLVK